MKGVKAQFKPTWRPTRLTLGGLAVLAVATAGAIGVLVWEHARLASLQSRIARMTEDRTTHAPRAASQPTPAYEASARQYLRERGAGWAPMLRTLESGAMVGVTPTSVEFNAQDGVARVQLNYSNASALLDYLGRINEGVSQHGPRWTLEETHEQPGAAQDVSAGVAGELRLSPTMYSATIRSVWQEEGTGGAP